MPKDDKNKRNVNKMLDSLDNIMDDLFTTVYHTTNRNDIIFDKVSTDLNDTIKAAIEGDPNYQDIANTTKLYQKIVRNNGGTGTSNSLLQYTSSGLPTDNNILDMFNDNAFIGNLMETYADTKWIEQLDEDIDMCLKYMPKLKTALDIKRDNVLCADSFSKTYLNFRRLDAVTGDDKEKKFSENTKTMIKAYDLMQRSEEWYELASKYGETFVYVVPYKKALTDLLARKRNTTAAGINSYMREVSIVKEGANFVSSDAVKYNVTASARASSQDSSCGSINLKLDRSGMLSEVVENIYKISNKINSDDMFCSVYESFLQESMSMNESNSSFEDHMKKNKDNVEIKFDKTIDDILEVEDEDKTARDGLVSPARQKNLEQRIKVPGVVIRTLERAKVIPLYIEDIPLGFYYIRVNPANLVDVNMNATTNGYNSITSMFNTNTTTNKELSGDTLLKKLSAEISRSIDANFINANMDLKKEIYMMLKYNDTFNQVTNAMDLSVTFIPAEDIVHYHFNFDKKIHRGRSDLWDSLIPAKMWIMVNTTTTLGQVTRSQDRRLYYVKNVVDTNVSKTLINVVNQIKKGNFGIRQIESINNILGILGKFNDFVVPVGPSGDSPITFDIMSGQQFELPSELMQNLEENAISSTGVPLEIVNSSNQMDFAIRYTMTNAMLLRNVLKRQIIVEEYLTKICNKIYNCEFEENVSFKVELPPPAFLTLTQGSQLIQNAVQYIDSLTEIEMADAQDDKERNMFKRKMLHNILSNYIDVELINRIKDEIRIEMTIEKDKSGGDDM